MDIHAAELLLRATRIRLSGWCGVSLRLKGAGAGESIPVATAVSGLVISGDTTGLLATGPNGDAPIDFSNGENNRCRQAFIKQAAGAPVPIQVADLVEERCAVGAKIFLAQPDGKERLHEVFPVQVYLSQAPQRIFGRGKFRRSSGHNR